MYKYFPALLVQQNVDRKYLVYVHMMSYLNNIFTKKMKNVAFNTNTKITESQK